MKSAIITAATAVTGLVVGGLIGCLHTFWTYPRRYSRLTGGSFRETYEVNEPQNPDDFERYFADCGFGGESDD